MCCRDEVYVVNALVLTLKKNVPQALDRDGLSGAAAAYVTVLTEHAAQVAAGEEHGAGASLAADARLLAEVGSGSCDDGRERGAADAARFVKFPVGAAAPRTVVTQHKRPLRNVQIVGLSKPDGSHYSTKLLIVQQILKTAKKFIIYGKNVIK